MDSFQDASDKDVPMIYLEGDVYVSKDFARYYAGA